jgi:hypothetical protein
MGGGSDDADGGANAPAAAVTSGRGRPSPLVPDWLVDLAALGWRIIVITALVIVLWFVAAILWTVTASIAVAVIRSGRCRMSARGHR